MGITCYNNRQPQKQHKINKQEESKNIENLKEKEIDSKFIIFFINII